MFIAHFRVEMESSKSLDKGGNDSPLAPYLSLLGDRVGGDTKARFLADCQVRIYCFSVNSFVELRGE